MVRWAGVTRRTVTSAPDPNNVFAVAVEMTRSSLSVGSRFAASTGPFAIFNAFEIMRPYPEPTRGRP